MSGLIRGSGNDTGTDTEERSVTDDDVDDGDQA
jgi:hypothetical protein